MILFTNHMDWFCLKFINDINSNSDTASAELIFYSDPLSTFAMSEMNASLCTYAHTIFLIAFWSTKKEGHLSIKRANPGAGHFRFNNLSRIAISHWEENKIRKATPVNYFAIFSANWDHFPMVKPGLLNRFSKQRSHWIVWEQNGQLAVNGPDNQR